METDERVGRNVRALREALGLSQAQLAAALNEAVGAGWFPQTVTKIEQGVRSLKLVEGLSLAKVLGVPADQLFEAGPTAEDDQAARRAIGELRKISDALSGDMARLREVEAALTHAVERGAMSPQVADQVTQTLEAYGAEGTTRRLANVSPYQTERLLRIVEDGLDPHDYEPDPDDEGSRIK